MKLFLLILVGFIFVNKVNSQNAYGKITVEFEIDSDSVYTKAQIMGAVPNGDSTWKDSILKKIKTSTFVKNGAKKGKYTVVVQYIVDKEGSISDVKALTNHGYGMERETVKVIQKGPVWKPAPQGGREVRPLRTSSNAPRQ